MTFRADESANNGFESVRNYFISRDFSSKERERSESKLLDIIEQYGPVVDSYPSWHPLVTHHDDRNPSTTPSDSCGYKSLDHTRYFVNAFITCPYGDGQDVIDSVESLSQSPGAIVRAERLDVKLYNSNATPILIRCDWQKRISDNKMIPASIALPLMLQKEVPCWEWA
jgi:hypothetical protein